MPEYRMHAWPDRRWRRLSMVALLLFSTGLTLAAPANKSEKTEELKSDLEQIKQKIQQLTTTLNASQDARQDAHQALKASETAISASRKKLRAIQQAQNENRETLLALQQQMRQLKRQVNQQQSAMAQQLNQHYRHGQHSPLQLWLQQQDPAMSSRQLHYLRYLTKAHQQQIQSLQTNQAEIDRVQTQTSQQMQATDALAQEYTAANQQLEQEKAQRQKLLATLSKQVETQQQQLSRLKQDEAALSQLMQRLLAEAKKRQQQEDAARARRERKNSGTAKRPPADNSKMAGDASVRKQGRVFEHAAETRVDNNEAPDSAQVVAKNDTLPEGNGPKERFSELRGRLRLPVRGEVVNRFGTPRSDTGVNWKGLFIRASEGSEVRAIAAGQVVFADWMRGFGNLLVIDHGDGYMSLYGNNEALYKSSGQRVQAGDSIAAVGNSGGNADNGVYYELRRNSQPFDPLAWSAVK